MQPYLEIARTQVNSDYYPFVDLRAGEARFRNRQARNLVEWQTAPIPLLEMLNQASIDFAEVTSTPNLDVGQSKVMAYRAFGHLMNLDVPQDTDAPLLHDERLRVLTEWVMLSEAECRSDGAFERWHGIIHDLALHTLPFLAADDAETYVERLFNPVCDVQQGSLANAWHQLYRSVASRDAEGMAKSGTRLLERDEGLSLRQKSYLIGVSMLGHIAAGEMAEAHDIWTSQGEGFYKSGPLSSHMKLLAGIAVGSARDEKR